MFKVYMRFGTVNLTGVGSFSVRDKNDYIEIIYALVCQINTPTFAVIVA